MLEDRTWQGAEANACDTDNNDQDDASDAEVEIATDVSVAEVYLAYDRDQLTGRDEVRIWSTSSALLVDLSVDEWRALCTEIAACGDQILDVTKLGSRTAIRVDPGEKS